MPTRRLAPLRALRRAALAGCLTLGAAACGSEADDVSDMDGTGGTGVLPPSTAGAGAGLGTAGTTPSDTTTGSGSGAGGNSSAGAGAGGGGMAGSAPIGGSGSGGVGGAAPPDLSSLEPFSFFVTSLAAMQRLSGNPNGFGGDLRYGEADGLSGADKICTEIAEASMPGSGAKQWRAFLSAVNGPGGGPVHAIDRIGDGPWYDRIGRLFSMNKASLIGFRPTDTDPAIVDDFPNEDGVPNHDPDGTGAVDNHDTLTGTNSMGQVYAMDPLVTCNDWTTSEPTGRPRVGHAWPRFSGGMGFPFPGGGGFAGTGGGFPPFPGGTGEQVDISCFMNDGLGGGGLGEYGHWMSSLSEAGCAAIIYLIDDLNMDCADRGVGSGGGYGGIYCFALNP
jgi:hypothetical protein